MKLGQFQKEISKAPLPVSAHLGNDFKLIILETSILMFHITCDEISTTLFLQFW